MRAINQIITLTNTTRSSNSLAIPANLKAKFQNQTKIHGSIPLYFCYLIKSYSKSKQLKMLLNDLSSNIRYQEYNQNLQRINFLPKKQYWEEFRTLANGLGLSMCLLFTYFLILDLEQAEKKITKIDREYWNTSTPLSNKQPQRPIILTRYVHWGEDKLYRHLEVSEP